MLAFFVLQFLFLSTGCAPGCAATNVFTPGTEKVFPGKLSECDIDKAAADADIISSSDDTLGDIALVVQKAGSSSTCWSGTSYSSGDFLVTRGTISNLPAYKISPPKRIATKWAASQVTMYWKAPKGKKPQQYAVYRFTASNGIFEPITVITKEEIEDANNTFIKIMKDGVKNGKPIREAAIQVAKLNKDDNPVTFAVVPADTNPNIPAGSGTSNGVQTAVVSTAGGFNITMRKYDLPSEVSIYDQNTDWVGFDKRTIFLSHHDATYSTAKRMFPCARAGNANGVVFQDEKVPEKLYMMWLGAGAAPAGKPILSELPIGGPPDGYPVNGLAATDGAWWLQGAVCDSTSSRLWYVLVYQLKGNEKQKGTPKKTKIVRVNTMNGALEKEEYLDPSPKGLNIDRRSSTAGSLAFLPAGPPSSEAPVPHATIGMIIPRVMNSNHQGAIAVVIDAITLTVIKKWVASAHSFANQLTTSPDGTKFIGVDLGDNYPRGINVHEFDRAEKKSNVVFHVKTAHAGNQNHGDCTVPRIQGQGTCYVSDKPCYKEISRKPDDVEKACRAPCSEAAKKACEAATDCKMPDWCSEAKTNAWNARSWCKDTDCPDALYYEWSNDNRVYSEIANLVPIGRSGTAAQGHLVFFAGEQPTLDNSQISTDPKNPYHRSMYNPRNLGCVKISNNFFAASKKDLAGEILTPGAVETGFYYAFGGGKAEQTNRGLMWLTKFGDATGRSKPDLSESVTRIKATRIGANKNLVMYEVWSDTGAGAGAYLRTELMIVDDMCTVTKGPSAATYAVRLNPTDTVTRQGETVVTYSGSRSKGVGADGKIGMVSKLERFEIVAEGGYWIQSKPTNCVTKCGQSGGGQAGSVTCSNAGGKNDCLLPSKPSAKTCATPPACGKWIQGEPTGCVTKCGQSGGGQAGSVICANAGGKNDCPLPSKSAKTCATPPACEQPLKPDWKLGNGKIGEGQGYKSIEACRQRAKKAGASYFSYRNDGGTWCQWGNKDSFDAGSTQSHYHAYAVATATTTAAKTWTTTAATTTTSAATATTTTTAAATTTTTATATTTTTAATKTWTTTATTTVETPKPTQETPPKTQKPVTTTPKPTTTTKFKASTVKPTTTVPDNSGMMIKSKKATIEFGPDGDVKIRRIDDGKLSIEADVDITGSLDTGSLYIGGMSLKEYITMEVAKKF